MTTAPGTTDQAGAESYSIKSAVAAMRARQAASLAAIEAGSQEEKQPEPAQPIKRGRPSARDLLIRAVEADGLELGLAADAAYARVQRPGHVETYALRSEGFRRALQIIAHEHEISAITNTITEAVSGLEARAYAENNPVEVYKRAGRVAVSARVGDSLLLNAIIVDPGRPDRKLWLLGTGKGYQVIEATDSRAPWFYRGPGFALLPQPEPGGSLDALWDFVNVEPADRILFLGTMAHAWRPWLAQPVPVLLGEQGALKTSTMRTARRFVDPSFAGPTRLPKTPDELFVIASAAIMLSLDNLSGLDAEMSDALCMVATGGTRLTRRLYSDSELAAVSALAQVWATGISEFVARGDLASRAVVYQCPTVDPAARRAESDVNAALDAVAGQIMAEWLARVDAALSILSSVEQEKRDRPRMADLSNTGEALARALGYPAGTFDAAMLNNLESANDSVLEASPVAAAILRRVRERGAIDMAPAGLLAELALLAGEASHSPQWPRTASNLTSTIRRIAPALRIAGMEVVIGRRHHGRFIRVQQKENADTERHGDTEKGGESRFFND